MKKSELREMIREEIQKMNEKKKTIKGYSLVMMPAVGDKIEMKTSHGGIQGTIYWVSPLKHTFKLEDDYGNKNEKEFSTKSFKKAKIVREEIRKVGEAKNLVPYNFECMECGKKFSKKTIPKSMEIRCPRCKGYDVEPTEF